MVPIRLPWSPPMARAASRVAASSAAVGREADRVYVELQLAQQGRAIPDRAIGHVVGAGADPYAAPDRLASDLHAELGRGPHVALLEGRHMAQSGVESRDAVPGGVERGLEHRPVHGHRVQRRQDAWVAGRQGGRDLGGDRLQIAVVHERVPLLRGEQLADQPAACTTPSMPAPVCSPTLAGCTQA